MSGGHFDYKEAYLGYIADQLEADIKYNDVIPTFTAEDGYGYQLSHEIIEHTGSLARQLREIQEYLLLYDKVVSGDTSEDSYLERLGHEV